MFKVPTTTIYSRYPLPKSLPSGEGLTFTLSPQAVKR
ncbi:unknown [Alistipes sp. CAG:435]|nr:unknown [Alistipes sp. CAG:435]